MQTETSSFVSSIVPTECLDLLEQLLRRNPNTFYHSMRVGQLATQVAMTLTQDLSFIVNTCIAGVCHDVGKLYIPDKILHKDGRLTATERGIIDTHAHKGWEITPFLPEAIREAIRLHHANYCELDNCFCIAGIIHVCDVYDALSHKRSYKDPLSHKQCMEILRNDSGTSFDPVVVEMLDISMSRKETHS